MQRHSQISNKLNYDSSKTIPCIQLLEKEESVLPDSYSSPLWSEQKKLLLRTSINRILKVVINKQKTKVLYAEAGSDFADILFSFLTLPFVKIAKVLDSHHNTSGEDDEAPIVGSLSNLYRSMARLDNTHFVNRSAKEMLLRSWSSFEDVFRNLKLDISYTKRTQYFTCGESHTTVSRSKNICVYCDDAAYCDECGKTLKREVTVSDGKGGDGGGFALKSATFMISDDLRVLPSATPFFQTLTDFGINGDMNGAELMHVTFGVKEISGLLKCFLLSKTPLTDLILKNRQNSSLSDARQCQTKTSLHETLFRFLTNILRKNSENSKNISLRITVQKSTNKLLFAQAKADFVELLFSFLIIPLGGVESLLDSNTCLKNVDNLYRSVADAIDDKYFTTPTTKNRLMHPKLAHCYTSKTQFLPLCEESAPTFYYFSSKLYYNQVPNSCLVPFFKSPKGPGNYVKEPSTYLVTDDLTVTPGMTMALNILDRLNIPLSDVEELEVNIGLEEALRILKASLTSTSALSSGLVNQMPKKRPASVNMELDPRSQRRRRKLFYTWQFYCWLFYSCLL